MILFILNSAQSFLIDKHVFLQVCDIYPSSIPKFHDCELLQIYDT